MLASWMRTVDEAGGPSEATLKDAAIPQAPAALVRATEELLATSLLLGIDHASGRLDLADDSFSLPFEEAATFLKGRVPLTKKEWNALEPKLRFRAFTVAALSGPDAVERARQHTIAAVEKGIPLSEFWTAATAEGAAGLGASPWYWENVYRTNIQTAYNAGRAIELTRNQPAYLEFVGIGDVRQTEICRSRSGSILPASHPFWKTNWPPLHFSCRSTVRAVSQEEVDATREADPSWNPTADHELPDEPAAKGFGGNPVDEGSFWKMTDAMARRVEKLGLMGDIERLAGELGIARQEIEILKAKGSPPRAGSGKFTPAKPGKAASPPMEPQVPPGPVSVPKFRTLKEAERWVVSNDLAGACSFKGCDLRVVQMWTEELTASYQDFPSARRDLQFFGTIQERNAMLRRLAEEPILAQLAAKGIVDPRSIAYAKQLVRRNLRIPRVTEATLAQYAPWDGVKGISLNAQYGASFDKFLGVRKNDVAHGWKPVGTDKVSATLHHEAGHWLDAVYGLSLDPELNSLYQSLSKADLESGLSGYAASKRGGVHALTEFIAEAWSEFKESASPRPISKKVGEIIERRARGK